MRFDIDVETPTGGRVKRDDYRLSAHFAKKLSMKGSGEKAEQAREYFTRVEEKAKEMVINRSQLSPQMQMVMSLAESMARAVSTIRHFTIRCTVNWKMKHIVF